MKNGKRQNESDMVAEVMECRPGGPQIIQCARCGGDMQAPEEISETVVSNTSSTISTPVFVARTVPYDGRALTHDHCPPGRLLAISIYKHMGIERFTLHDVDDFMLLIDDIIRRPLRRITNDIDNEWTNVHERKAEKEYKTASMNANFEEETLRSFTKIPNSSEYNYLFNGK